MTSKRGAFIAIEGTDGSGKGTQFQLLRDRLLQAGYQVETFDFPQYGQPSSYFVTQYLNGAYGTAEAVGPYTASLFYALDRYEAAPRIHKALDEGKIVISNRFTGSSMGHQGAKFSNPEERRGYFIWLDNLEFEMLRIPRPDISFVLRVPADIAHELIGQKGERAYTDKQRDIHEADLQHLERSVAVYDDLTSLFPKDFQRIDCIRSGKLLDVETIQNMLWEKVMPLLPQPPQLEMAMTAAAPEVAATETETMTPPDEALADGPDSAETEASATAGAPIAVPSDAPYVTDPTAKVYAFTAALPPAIVAAVIASLSRSGGTLSTTILKEFAEAATKDTALLSRTVATYGDAALDFVSQHVVVSNASHLLASAIQDGRGGAYSTPQVRYLHYEQKDTNGLYKYHLPSGLSSDVAVHYRQQMDRIFDLYAKMLPQLGAHLIETSGVPVQGRSNDWQAAMHAEAHQLLSAVLPVAAHTTMAVYASAATLQSLITRLRAQDLPEMSTTAHSILQELRKTIPAFMDEIDKPDRGGSMAAYRHATRQAIQQLAAKHLPANHANETPPIQLVGVWPRNELDLIGDILYEHSTLPLRTLQQESATWPYTRKLAVFEAYVGQRMQRRERPGRALEKAHYSWDVLCDFAIFCELQRHGIVEDRARQALTPRYGYDIPQIIEAAGISEQFETCFDISLALYSALQDAGYPEAAQYATLFGHRLRCKLTYNAREAFTIHELHTTPHADPKVRAFVTALHEKLAEVHPLIAEAMQFVTNGIGTDLNKLATDRYEQFNEQFNRQQQA